MQSVLPDIAVQLGANERTLRRAAQRGAVHCHRAGPRSLELPPGELTYLRNHWALLSALTQAFRTEPKVNLAVLYGSMARGSGSDGSDVDVLVDFRHDAGGSTSALARRLEGRLGVPVDVASRSRVESESPLLLLQAIDDGRVLIDRGDAWKDLHHRRESIARAARRQMARSRREAVESLSALLEDS